MEKFRTLKAPRVLNGFAASLYRRPITLQFHFYVHIDWEFSLCACTLNLRAMEKLVLLRGREENSEFFVISMSITCDKLNSAQSYVSETRSDSISRWCIPVKCSVRSQSRINIQSNKLFNFIAIVVSYA
jgi:hypothetical protein